MCWPAVILSEGKQGGLKFGLKGRQRTVVLFVEVLTTGNRNK
jgi:hypothetical protein